jgi:putative ABC transport system permease protein
MLKGWEAYTKPHKLQLRKILVTVQFMIAAIMMMGTLIVYQQLIFMLREKPGFDNEQILIFRLLGVNRPDNQIASSSIFLKSEIQKLSMVENITTSSSIPGKAINTERFAWREDSEIPVRTKCIYVDDNFFHFYNLEFLAGRQFSPNAINDTAIAQYVTIINEALMHKLGFEKPEDAIGQKISWKPKEILGVIKNYHHGSFHNDYIPLQFSPEGDMWFHSRLGMLLFPDAYTIFSIKLKTTGQSHTDLSTTIQKISDLFKTIFPNMLFEHYFLDEYYNRQYVKDISYSKLITIFAILAVFISCIGLFGLSLFIIRQRTKEIGIRKALGASSESLFYLLSRKHLSLVLIASILSIPVAWWGLKQWLQQYAFRIELKWWYFALPILLSLLIALISVGYQTIKATMANPVDALRYE